MAKIKKEDHSIAACRAAGDRVMALVYRRKWLSDSNPKCPKCGETWQLQLTDYIYADKAQWRCRICRHRFEYEPDQPMKEPIEPAHIIEAKRWDSICALLEEVINMHADPTIAEYNECDKDPCQWCVDAKKAMDKTTGY